MEVKSGVHYAAPKMLVIRIPYRDFPSNTNNAIDAITKLNMMLQKRAAKSQIPLSINRTVYAIQEKKKSGKRTIKWITRTALYTINGLGGKLKEAYKRAVRICIKSAKVREEEPANLVETLSLMA